MRVTNWAQQCEADIVRLTNGKLTPGSGNKRQKGDVITPEGGCIEVKSTIHDTISIQYEWLEKLERIAKYQLVDVCLVIVFGDGSNHVYYPDQVVGASPFEPWATIKATKTNVPRYLATPTNTWYLDDLESLQDWLK